MLTNDLTNGAREEGAGGWERGQLFPGDYSRQQEHCKGTLKHMIFFKKELFDLTAKASLSFCLELFFS